MIIGAAARYKAVLTVDLVGQFGALDCGSNRRYSGRTIEPRTNAGHDAQVLVI